MIGDIHCESQSLKLAVDTLTAQRLTTIVCTGDLPTGPGDVNLCCDSLRSNNIITVRGNHDRWLLDRNELNLPFATPPETVSNSSWQFLESLPVTVELTTAAGLALLCHGFGAHDMLSFESNQPDSELLNHPIFREIYDSSRYRFIINGHSHRPEVRRLRSLTIMNAGTLRSDHQPVFAEIDFECGLVQFWEIIDRQYVRKSNRYEI